MLVAKAIWETWEEPDRDVAVAYWKERDIAIVFPMKWAKVHGQPAMIGHAKERIAEVEGVSDRTIVAGSVLLAFSRHLQVMQPIQRIDPEAPHALAILSPFPQ